MTRENEEEFISRCNEIVNKHEIKKLTDAVCEVEKIIKGTLKPESLEELKGIIKEANNNIDKFAGDNDELYEKFAYRLFVGNKKGPYIAQGTEVMDVHERYERASGDE